MSENIMREKELGEAESPKYKKIKERLEKNWFGVAIRLFPEETNEILKPLIQKYASYVDRFITGALTINLDMMESMEGREKVKKYEKESEPFYEKLENFIKEKPLEEIYRRAEQMGEKFCQTNDFYTASVIAERFLSEQEAKKILRKYFEYENQRLGGAKDINTAKDFLTKFHEVLTEQEILDLLEKLEGNSEFAFKKAKELVEEGKIKKITPKIYEIVRDEARRRIEVLLKEGEKKDALGEAEFFERFGFLKVDSDGDLFEKLTAS